MSADHSPSTWVVRDNPDVVVRLGQEAWGRLQADRTWEDWLAIGKAIQIGRHHAMVAAKQNRPAGSRYENLFGDWLRENGFDTLDKAARKRLLDCLEHRAEIEAWRQTLPTNKRMQLNHPSSVWRNWQKATVAGKAAGSEKPGRLSPIGRLKQEVVRLEDENLQLRRAGDDLFSSKDSAADIARLIADHLLQRLTPTKAREIAKLLQFVIAERAELPREPMTAAPPMRGKKYRPPVKDFESDIAAKRRRESAEAAS
jgi:hypothetical protein